MSWYDSTGILAALLVVVGLPAPGCSPRPARPPARAAAPAAKVHPDDRGTERWFADEAMCRWLRRGLVCGRGGAVRIAIAVNLMTGPTACRAWCATPSGTRHGEFRQISIGISNAGVRLVGRYDRGVPVGRWTTSRWRKADCRGRTAPGPGCQRFSREIEEHYDARGRLHGTQLRWSRRGKLQLREECEHGRLVGRFESFHRDGKPWWRGRLASGTPPKWWPLIGLSHPSPSAPGAKRLPLSEDKSVPVGRWRTWHENGRLAVEQQFDARGRPDGSFCYYRTDGTRIACYDLRGGTGTLVEHDASGARLRQLPFVRGELHGVGKIWKEGRLVKQVRFRRGKAHGARRLWDAQGRLTLRETWRDDLLHGPYMDQDFNDDGSREVTRGHYCRDRKCKRWTVTRPPSRYREVEVRNAQGDVIARRLWDARGALQESWSYAEERRKARQECIRILAKGGCCVREQNPPPGARICTGCCDPGP